MSILDALIADPLAAAPPFVPIWKSHVKTIDEPGRSRLYVTPDGTFPSVTSVLGHGSDMSWLETWRQNVGEEKADNISRRSRERGTTMHAVLEAAIRREDPAVVAGEDYESLEMARAIARQLFPNVRRMFGLETAVWSKRLRIAGRLDGAGVHNGENAIIDFKNARHLKNAADIQGYFRQASLYSMLLLERTGVHCPKIIIAIAQGDDRCGQAQIFEERAENFLEAAFRQVRCYHRDTK